MNLFRVDMHNKHDEGREWDDFEYIQANSYAEAEAIINAHNARDDYRSLEITVVSITFITSRILSKSNVTH